jgi:hypothetical protein
MVALTSFLAVNTILEPQDASTQTEPKQPSVNG